MFIQRITYRRPSGSGRRGRRGGASPARRFSSPVAGEDELVFLLAGALHTDSWRGRGSSPKIPRGISENLHFRLNSAHELGELELAAWCAGAGGAPNRSRRGGGRARTRRRRIPNVRPIVPGWRGNSPPRGLHRCWGADIQEIRYQLRAYRRTTWEGNRNSLYCQTAQLSSTIPRHDYEENTLRYCQNSLTSITSNPPIPR